jgi:hypothetical protein
MMRKDKNKPGKRLIGNLLHGPKRVNSLLADSLRFKSQIGIRDFTVHHLRGTVSFSQLRLVSLTSHKFHSSFLT